MSLWTRLGGGFPCPFGRENGGGVGRFALMCAGGL
jgi:hypothetical protein